MENETALYVFYDVSNDKVRNKLGDICRDYGLTHIQFSGYYGTLSKNKREELCLRLQECIGEEKASLLVQPVCAKCTERLFSINFIKTMPEANASVAATCFSDKFWSEPLRPQVPQDDGY